MTAQNHINIATTTRRNQRLCQIRDLALSLLTLVDEEKAVYDQTVIGDNFAQLATDLDLSDPTATDDATAIYNLLGSVQSELSGDVFLHQLLARIG